MKSLEIEMPAGWRIFGELLDVNPDTLSDADLVVLTEDILQIQSPDGSFMMDVSWLPDSDRQGNYVCRVILYDNWEAPIELFETRETREAYFWIQRCFTKLENLEKARIVGRLKWGDLKQKNEI